MAQRINLREMNYSADDLIIFKRVKAGWFTPDFKLMPFPLYQHLDALKSINFHPELFEEISEAEDKDLEARNDFADSVPEDEHIPWHCFDDSQYVDEAKQNIAIQAYEEGYIRLAIHHDKLHVEGKIFGKELEELADMLNLILQLPKPKKKRR